MQQERMDLDLLARDSKSIRMIKPIPSDFAPCEEEHAPNNDTLHSEPL